jgi:O-antigen/teichoic acid export membrane protein
MTASLSRVFARGVAWFYVLSLSSRLIGLAQSVLVARFLSPTDFGVMGVALLVLSFLEMIATTGYNQALIQKKEDISDYLDTAWVVTAIRGLVLGGIVYLCAPFAAAFFQEPRAVSILRLMALSPILNGLLSPGLVVLNKDLHFKRLVMFEAARSILGATVAVLSAVLFRSVWALAVASLVNSAVLSLGSFLIHPYRPGLGFRWRKARELWSFGKWVLGSKALHYLFNDGDDWVAGRLLGSTALGFYQTAYRLGCAPMSEITAVFSKVTFPTFAKLQDDTEKLRRAYLRILQVIMFASTPLAIGILLVARDGVELFLGQKWLPMVASLQILVCWGWIRSFRATTGPVFLAQGRPDVVAKLTAFKVAILAALIVPLSSRWDIVGTSWAVVIAAVLEIPLLVRGLSTAVQTNFVRILERMMRPFFSAVPMIGVVVLLQQLLSSQSVVFRLGAAVVPGAVVYVLLTFLLDRWFQWGLRADLEQAIGHNVQPILRLLRSLAPRGLAAGGE